MIAGNLSLQTFDGHPVLAWWQGTVNREGSTTDGEYVVVDQHYRTVARLRGAGGWVLDVHDIAIRGDDAWVTAIKNVDVSLSRYGGSHNGTVVDTPSRITTSRRASSFAAGTHWPTSH